MADEPPWLAIARELRAIAQTGLTFSQDQFDRQRYERVRELTATMLSLGSGADRGQILRVLLEDKGYGTPKIDVRGAAFVQDRVLLVREIGDGKWTLPGGWADVNQTAAECVAREIAEESGFEARAVKIAAVYDFHKRNQPALKPDSIYHLDSIYKIFFICEITGGAARAGDETSEAAFFRRDALPELSVGRSTAAQILRMFEHREQPTLAADFD